MSLPNVNIVRERIEQVDREDVRTCLMCGYLFCARVSELISKISPSDLEHTTPRGPKGSDVRVESFELGPVREKAAVFTISTAKRDGIERLVALPLDEKYEPWTSIVYDYFQQRKKQPCFPFTRQKIWQSSRSAFKGLKYPIERYVLIENRGEKKIRKVVDRHMKPFATHALRHMRTRELLERYGFEWDDLSIYGGWTLRSMLPQVSASMQRYAHLRWQQYFPKLLKEREKN